MKLRHDFAGHYNRPDIFQLHINRRAPQIYAVHGGEGAEMLPGGDAAPELPQERLGGLLGSPREDD